MQAWSIEGAGGRIWAASSLGGVGALAAELLARVPRDRMDAEAAVYLERRAARAR